MSVAEPMPEHRDLLRRTIRAAMAANRMSQEELGVAMGHNQAYISRRLRGETPFDEDDLARLAEIFRCSQREFYPDKGTSPIIYLPSLFVPGTTTPAFDFTSNTAGLTPLAEPA